MFAVSKFGQGFHLPIHHQNPSFWLLQVCGNHGWMCGASRAAEPFGGAA